MPTYFSIIFTPPSPCQLFLRREYPYFDNFRPLIVCADVICEQIRNTAQWQIFIASNRPIPLCDYVWPPYQTIINKYFNIHKNRAQRVWGVKIDFAILFYVVGAKNKYKKIKNKKERKD